MKERHAGHTQGTLGAGGALPCGRTLTSLALLARWSSRSPVHLFRPDGRYLSEFPLRLSCSSPGMLCPRSSGTKVCVCAGGQENKTKQTVRVEGKRKGEILFLLVRKDPRAHGRAKRGFRSLRERGRVSHQFVSVEFDFSEAGGKARGRLGSCGALGRGAVRVLVALSRGFPEEVRRQFLEQIHAAVERLEPAHGRDEASTRSSKRTAKCTRKPRSHGVLGVTDLEHWPISRGRLGILLSVT